MPTAAALFQFRKNGGAWGVPGAWMLVASGDEVEARIADLEGVERVEWEQHGSSRTETEEAAPDLELTMSGVPLGAVVAFTVPTFDGAAWGLTAKINGGATKVGQGIENGTWTAKSKIVIPFTNGNKGCFVGETFEEDSIFAAVPKINWLLKYPGEGGGDLTDALNVGDGIGIRKTKASGLIHLRSHRGTNGISITLNADNDTIDVSGANFPTSAVGLDGIDASFLSQAVRVRSSRDSVTFALEADNQNVSGMNNLDIIRLDPTVDNAIWGGMTVPGSDDTHRQLVRNVHSTNRAIIRNEDGGSSADARFRTPLGLDFVIEPGASAWIDWDSVLQRRFVSEPAAATVASLQPTAGVAAMGHFLRIAHGKDFGAETDPNTAPSSEINCVFVPGWNEWIRLGFDSFSGGSDHSEQKFGTSIYIAKFSAVEGGHTSATQTIPPYGGWVDDSVSSLPEFAETPLFTVVVPGETPRVVLTHGKVDSFPDTTQRVSYSDDCGTTWVEGNFETESIAGARALIWSGINLVAGFPDGIIEISSSGGATWTVADSPATGATHNVLLTNGVGTVVSVLANRVHRSVDDGATFVEVEVTGISARAGIFFEGTFYAWTTDNEVWRSPDGETWTGPTAINLNVPGWTALRLLDINGRGIVICGSQIVGLFVDDDSANYSREDLFYTRDGINWTRSGSFGSTADADGVDVGTVVRPVYEGISSGAPHPARVRLFSTSPQNPAYPSAPWHQLIVVPAEGTYGDDPYWGVADCYIGPRDGGGVMVRETEVITQVAPTVVYEYYGSNVPLDITGFGAVPVPIDGKFSLSCRTPIAAGGMPSFALTTMPESGEELGTLAAAEMNRGGIIKLFPTQTPTKSICVHVWPIRPQGWTPQGSYWLWRVLDIKSLAAAWDPSAITDEFTSTISASLGAPVRSMHFHRVTGQDVLVLAGTTLFHLQTAVPWSLRSNWQVIDSLDLAAYDNAPRAAVWNSDGLRIFYIGNQNNAIRQLNLGWGRNLSEATEGALSFSLASYGTDPVGLSIAPNDQYLYALFNSNNSIVQFEFATLGTLTGLDDVNTPLDIGVLTGETAPTCMAHGGGGATRHFYVYGSVTNQIHHITTTADDISTGALAEESTDQESLDDTIVGLAVAIDGSKLFGIGDENDVAIEWNLIPLEVGTDCAIEFVPKPTYAITCLGEWDAGLGYGGAFGIFNKELFAPNAITTVHLHFTWGTVEGEVADEADEFDGSGFLVLAVQTNGGTITKIILGGPSGLLAHAEVGVYMAATINGSGHLKPYLSGNGDGVVIVAASKIYVSMEIKHVMNRGQLDA